MDTKATYVHPLSEAEMSPSYAAVQTQQDRFWVIYDEKNVVKDFGFTAHAWLLPKRLDASEQVLE